MKDKLLKESKVFCMMPWVHIQMDPSGVVKPCCISPRTMPIGNLKDNTLVEIWNSPEQRQLRLDMLAGNKNEMCNRCYEIEESGSLNLRQDSIQHFSQHFDLVEKTKEDGTVDEFSIKYMDFRFSNVCNFRCRSCGPQLSSRWHSDTVKLYGSHNEPAIIRPTDDPEDLWRQLEPIIPGLEEIYFAGGEPLIMEEHYRILKKLDELGLYHVRLKYNTNLSEMRFKQLDVMPLWAKFDTVQVGASLDAMGARGEYMRKGQDWQQTIDNRKRMMEICPNAHFFVSATVSLMNAWHLPDFHREWVEQGLLEPDNFHTNLLLEPEYYRVQVLPEKYKKEIEAKYREHIDTFLTPSTHERRTERAVRCFESVITFMNQQDCSDKIPKLREYTRAVDEIRDERFEDVFPELDGLLDE